MAIARKKWTSTRPSGVVDRSKHTAVLHHTVSPNRKWTKRQEIDHMRALRSQHVDINGWSDIGYSFVLFPSGRLYTARGPELVPAAQSGHNSGTIAIAYVGDGRYRDISRVARLRLRAALISLRLNRKIKYLKAHRNFGGTVCPGDVIYKRLPNYRKFTGLK